MGKCYALLTTSIVLMIAVPLPAQEGDYHMGNTHIGGGFSVPVNPTARFAGTSGSFQIGGGYNFDKHNSFVGEFMWAGLRPTTISNLGSLVADIRGVGRGSNLYALTANYMFRHEGHRFGAYGIAGGGWYYRHSKLTETVTQPFVSCSPYWLWWGFSCTSGYVNTDQTLASWGSSAVGANGGIGFTIKVADSGEKFYMESRFHWAPTRNVSTRVIPVTFGFRW